MNEKGREVFEESEELERIKNLEQYKEIIIKKKKRMKDRKERMNLVEAMKNP